MSKRKYSEVKMIGALKQLEAGRTAALNQWVDSGAKCPAHSGAPHATQKDHGGRLVCGR